MPAPFGLECPHLHCTRVHNKGLQMPTSSCAKAQLKIRAPKKMPASTSAGMCPKDTRVGLLACVQEIRVSASLRASKRCPRRPRHTRVQEDTCVGLLLRAPKMAAPTWTRAKMHASPLSPAPRSCARLGG